MPPFVVTKASTRPVWTTRRQGRRDVHSADPRLPGFAGYFLIEATTDVRCSISLFETPEQADESRKLVSKWISDENFSRAIPNPPKITSGKVVAQSRPGTRLARPYCRVTERARRSRASRA